MAEKEVKFPSHINYLCIEGVIGAGKTSLCNLLARRFDGRIILEEAEENPFLQKFYTDRGSYAFQTQLWFLVSRYKQLSVMLAQQDLFYQATISDYMFAKDRIFATINLQEDEYNLYNSIARVMESSIPRPDLVVYLQASTDVLLRRIEKRGRPFEFNMDPQYLDALNQAYNHFFFHYSASPLLIINTNEIDFVNSNDDLEELVEQIVNVRTGTNFFQPMGLKERIRMEERKLTKKDQS
jgi:deoxyguanosine kinase